MKLRKEPQPGNDDARRGSASEKDQSRHYYHQDGALRAYANRAMVLAFLCVPATLVAIGLAAYVRMQPPTVIRVNETGEASVLGAKGPAISRFTADIPVVQFHRSLSRTNIHLRLCVPSNLQRHVSRPLHFLESQCMHETACPGERSTHPFAYERSSLRESR